jgi:hypothetical protein
MATRTLVRIAVLAVVLPAVVALGAADCGGRARCTFDDPTANLPGMSLCDDSDSCDECASPATCAAAICLASNGSSCDDPSAHGSVCTLGCGSDADCAGLPETQTWTVSAGAGPGPVHWSCVGGVCFGYYGYTTINPCEGCGGAFCSGDCAGCPGC